MWSRDYKETDFKPELRSKDIKLNGHGNVESIDRGCKREARESRVSLFRLVLKPFIFISATLTALATIP